MCHDYQLSVSSASFVIAVCVMGFIYHSCMCHDLSKLYHDLSQLYVSSDSFVIDVSWALSTTAVGVMIYHSCMYHDLSQLYVSSDSFVIDVCVMGFIYLSCMCHDLSQLYVSSASFVTDVCVMGFIYHRPYLLWFYL